MTQACKLLSVTLRSPHGIQKELNRHGAGSWRVRGATASFLFLEQAPGPRESKVVSITVRGPRGILHEIERCGSAGGWELGAVGASFLFFDRAVDGAGRKLEYRMESITLRSPAGVRRLADQLGGEGWRLRAMGPSLAIFEHEDGDRNLYRHEFESITLRTPASIQALVNEREQDGWALSDASRNFVAFSRPKS
jgi:hypothetical protein